LCVRGCVGLKCIGIDLSISTLVLGDTSTTAAAVISGYLGSRRKRVRDPLHQERGGSELNLSLIHTSSLNKERNLKALTFIIIGISTIL